MKRFVLVGCLVALMMVSGGSMRAGCIGDECYIRMHAMVVNSTSSDPEDQLHDLANAEIEAVNACRNDIQCQDGCDELNGTGAFDCGGCAETSSPQGCSIEDSGIVDLGGGSFIVTASADGRCGCQCGDSWPAMMSVKPKPGRGGGS